MFILCVLSFIAAQVIGAPDFVTLLTPVVVYGVTELVKWGLPKLPGWLVISFIVPLLSMGVTWAMSLTGSGDTNFWVQVVYGLLAVFIREFLHQLTPAKRA